jgi:DNA helicase HerA-like ATPase
MLEDGKIFIGKGTKPEYLDLRLANRHGLVTGATGTGKTVSLQVLAEGFSNAGVPVFAADIKGDLSGMAAPGNGKEPLVKRAKEIGIEYVPDNEFLGAPALDIKDLMRTDRDGRGVVNILAADKLMSNPRLYATFLLWLMSELFEELPEVGDVDQPKLVFFFDEAHLLFDDAPKALVDTVERVVRLIRSKGIGVYFITQNPVDVPESVLAQLGNRVQHALRAYTPREQKAVRVAAQTFRQNPAFDTEKAITELGVGEALVSTLEGKGAPSMVERTLIAPPMAQVGPIELTERQQIMASSPMRGKYDQLVDPESAYEMLAKRAEQAAAEAKAAEGGGGILDMLGGLFGTTGQRKGSMTVTQRVTREVTRTIVNQTVGGLAAEIGKTIGGRQGSSIGRAIVRGTLGGLLRR